MWPARGHRRPRSGGAGAGASTAAPLLLLLLAAFMVALPAAAAQQTDAWTVVADPRQLDLEIVGPHQAPFDRPAPLTLDPSLLRNYAAQLNLLQDVAVDGGPTPFTATSEQYVATLRQGFVEGEGGLVYDAAGHVLHLPHHFFTRTQPLQPLPTHTPAEAAAACERHAALASVVQRYGHMYYHFLLETLPRVAILAAAGRLTPDVRLLTWGRPYEYEYLEALGVPRSQVVPYNASRLYCADRLLVPTPTPRITPPREGLQAVRTGLGVRTLPEAQRDLIVYVSREGEPSRRVANEVALLAAIRAAFPGQQLAVFKGGDGLSAAQTVALFQRARVVLGPHGAGLSHILFSAPGTAVLELGFLSDPPLMFWHAAGALGQPYWLLPVPQAHWLVEEMQVPVGEVLDVLSAVLRPAPADPAACPPGTHATSEDGARRCTACSPGSYAFLPGAAACKPCAPGHAARSAGATACRTCPAGTWSSADRRECQRCPAGTFSSLPGAWEAGQCLTPDQRRRSQEDAALDVQMLSKLSPVFDDARRRLIETAAAAGADGGAASLVALCEAGKLAGGFAGAYRGPYLLGTASGAALLANCSTLAQPAPSPPSVPEPSPSPAPAPAPAPADPPLPPVDVPLLPPVLLPPTPSAPDVAVDVLAMPQPEPPQEGEPQGPYPPKKKVVDDYVIILACVLGGLLLLPALAWVARRAWLAHQHRKSRASAATRRLLDHGPAGPAGQRGATAYSNPTFAPDASGRLL